MEPTKKTRNNASPVSIELEPDEKLAGLRILIVEDMGLVAQALRWMLDKMGCTTVGVASRLSEAKELAQNTEHLDGVLLDLNLSGEDSYPVAEILHKRGIPFIIMSGYDTYNSRTGFGSDAHLQKPFLHDDLATMMRRTFLPRLDVRKSQ